MILAALLSLAEPTSAIDAEYAFARDAQQLGQWTAFAKWAHDDGVLVGRNVIPAKAFAQSQQDPEQSLRWWPVKSIQSCDGKMAVNIGGWEDPASGQAGRFHTIWTLTDAGWRYLVDLGATGAAPLPDTGGVEIVRATCRNVERATPGIFTRTGQSPMKGASPDDSLAYFAGVDDDGRKSIMIGLWDGDHAERVYMFETPAAPEPSE